MKVYIYGCSCGVNGVYSRRVKAYAAENNIEISIINSKYDDASLMEHVALLQSANITGDTYEAIVEEDGTITKLREWKK